MSTETGSKQKQVNLNTVLMFIALGCMGWIGHETVSNGKEIAGMRESSLQKIDAWSRLEKKVDSLSNDVNDLRVQLATVPGIRPSLRSPKDQ